MARQLSESEADELLKSRQAPWTQWADGEFWLIDVTTDLHKPATLQRAAATAAAWARRNGYELYYEFRSSTEMAIRFRVDETFTKPPSPQPDYRDFFAFMNTHVEVTNKHTDELRFSDLWEAWDTHRATDAGNSAPRALRTIRRAIQQWVTDNDHTDKTIMPDVGRAGPARIYGLRLTAASPPSEHPAATPEPSPRPAMPSRELPPSPFGSKQLDEAPPAPAAPAIDWPALNALSVAIDKLDEDN